MPLVLIERQKDYSGYRLIVLFFYVQSVAGNANTFNLNVYDNIRFLYVLVKQFNAYLKYIDD